MPGFPADANLVHSPAIPPHKKPPEAKAPGDHVHTLDGKWWINQRYICQLLAEEVVIWNSQVPNG